MPVQSLRLKARQLHIQHSSLPLAQPVIRSVNIVTVKPLSRHASAVVHRARELLELVVIRDDHSAFACSHELAGLKAEGCGSAECTDLFPSPFAAMRMRRVLHQ